MHSSTSSTPALELHPVMALDELREPWSVLALEARNVFSSWEWASIWWRRYGAGRRLAVSAAIAENGRVAAIVPLYEWSARPFRIGRFVGHGPADQLGVVSAPEDRAIAVEALRRAVHEARFDLALAELLGGGSGWAEAMRSPPLIRESSPVVSLEGGWEAFLSGRSRNLRQQLGRRERRLAGLHSLHFRLASDRERLDADLAQFLLLHRARWGRRSALHRWEGFVREFASLAFDRGWLRLWFLELSGTPVATWLGFRFGDVESYYQAGRDPAHATDSVGFVLLAHTIREAARDGMREYRFLRGAEAFKFRFAESDPGVETYAIAQGLRGRAAVVLARAGMRSGSLRTLLRPIGRRFPFRM